MERDGRTWVVYQLSPYGESMAENGQLLEKVRKYICKTKEIFIPYYKIEFQGKITKVNVMEGYFFVESGLDENIYFSLATKAFIEFVMHTRTNKGNFLQTIRNEDVENLKDSLREQITTDLELGMEVNIENGIYKGLDGEIVGFTEDKSEAFVYIKLRTLRAIRAIPTYILNIQEDPDV